MSKKQMDENMNKKEDENIKLQENVEKSVIPHEEMSIDQGTNDEEMACNDESKIIQETELNEEKSPKETIRENIVIEFEDEKIEKSVYFKDPILSPNQRRRTKKTISRVMLFLMAFIIGLLLVILLNTAEKVTGGLSTSQRSLQLQTELKNVRAKREDKEAELKTLEIKMQELTLSEGSEEEISNQMKAEIAKYDAIIGNTEAIGQGVRLKMTDKNNGNLLANNYELILSVINKLNAAGAEAIAINGNRWGSETYLNLNKGLLYVGEHPIEGVITIEAIGDMNTLEASLNLRFGILHDLRNNYDIDCNVEKVEKLVLPKLNQIMNFEYGKPEVK